MIDIRSVLEKMEKKFGTEARMKIFVDGSGFIFRSLRDERQDIPIEFLGIGELRSILDNEHRKTETNLPERLV